MKNSDNLNKTFSALSVKNNMAGVRKFLVAAFYGIAGFAH